MRLTYSKARALSRTLLVFGLLCAILLTLSTRLKLGLLVGSHHAIQCSGGHIGWWWTISDLSREIAMLPHIGPFFADRSDESISWVFAHEYANTRGMVSLPLGYPMLATLIPGALIYYRHRFRPGHCKRCGYDLAGLEPGAPCPECGRVPD